VLGHLAALAAHLHDDAIEVDEGLDPIEPSLTPGSHFRVEVRRDLGDQWRRPINSVKILDYVLDVSGRQALGVQGENLLVEPRPPPLVLGNQLRFERALAIPRRVQGVPAGRRARFSSGGRGDGCWALPGRLV